MSITVTKTRDVLVDVARQLFARLGFDNTTMNDIAQASKKGRRTIYTYFKSKDDIFGAVIESEIDKLQEALADIAAKDLPADEKLITLIYTRLDAMKAIVFRNGTLRALFFRDIWRVEKARKKFDREEARIIRNILDDGVNAGIFDVPDTETMAMIIHHALKGFEVPYIRGKIAGTDILRASQKQNVTQLIFNGIKIK
ncbi:MAG: TetR/AcrR family transcriptional regulator [Tannerella sp.]|jgi:AcrR family transcriptional regulator|nr:TetR/AcrR family transcriptional regulator [Tannerella sp.]